MTTECPMTFDNTQEAYTALRDRIVERTSPFVPWVGAGPSVDAGLPDWVGLREGLQNALNRRALGYEEHDKERSLAALEAIRKEQNPWVAFDRIRRELGETTFRETIRETLRPAATVEVPRTLTYLWKLRPRAMLTLSLDRLATKAYALVRDRSDLTELPSGRSAGEFMYVHQSPNPFVANLHGCLEDSRSWVFTRSEVQALLRDDAYVQFIRTTLLTNTVLFLGLTPEDVAVGGHIEGLLRMGVTGAGCHFWLTSRRDRASVEWAEQHGIRVIRYDSTAGHAAGLAEVFEELLAYLPVEREETAPVVDATPAIDAETEARSDLERLRADLNRQAMESLRSESDSAYEAYGRFLEDHDEEIYRAWYVTDREPRNVLFGFTLEDEIATGGFGRVFRARGVEGEAVAIKLLREEHRRRPEMLRAFRRGVRSMRILTEHGAEGMVRFRGASEIPAFVAMDWVDGPNLKDAVLSGKLRDWRATLEVASQLAAIVQAAHMLPERVLHRDLRPTNVMLEGFWSEPNPNVVVLDFDLSWHRGAIEQSVVQSSAFGYLAPEQLERTSGVSTRHASVDSFGLGMTLYFLAGGRDPIADQHRHSDWRKSIKQAVERLGHAHYPAGPNRFARLIERATRDTQAERWDVSQICAELEQLKAAEEGVVHSAELLAEGLFAGSEELCDYGWSHERLEAVVVAANGQKVTLGSEERRRSINMTIEWGSRGGDERSRVLRWLPDALRDAEGTLRAGGWSVVAAQEFSGFHVTASIPTGRVQSDQEGVRRQIEKARRRLMFMQ
jgi:serine/threonine protein kinase